MNPDAVQLAGWLACAFFMAGGINQVLKLFDRAKEQPPPLETYATKAEVSLLRADVQRLEGKFAHNLEALQIEMRADRDSTKQANEVRAVKLHERINDVLAAVSELRGKATLWGAD
jgi:hypothetical protein